METQTQTQTQTKYRGPCWDAALDIVKELKLNIAMLETAERVRVSDVMRLLDEVLEWIPGDVPPPIKRKLRRAVLKLCDLSEHIAAELLIKAAKNRRNSVVVRMLLDAGVKPTTEALEVALEVAVEQGNVEVVRMLLDAGAEPTAETLEAVFWHEYLEDCAKVVRMLLLRGA